MTLSGGEAHCVAFYCALLSGNPILLADEPTTGLDANNFKRLTTLLNALAKDRIVLLTSHDSRVTPLANRHFTVGGGKIRADKG
jgi:ABC-type lipoprotein export system ATPase subunit